jgi:hypothetical protein
MADSRRWGFEKAKVLGNPKQDNPVSETVSRFDHRVNRRVIPVIGQNFTPMIYLPHCGHVKINCSLLLGSDSFAFRLHFPLLYLPSPQGDLGGHKYNADAINYQTDNSEDKDRHSFNPIRNFYIKAATAPKYIAKDAWSRGVLNRSGDISLRLCRRSSIRHACTLIRTGCL